MRIAKRPRLRLDLKSFCLLRLSTLKRDGWRCQSCGSSVGLEVHHITPRSNLGMTFKKTSSLFAGNATDRSNQNDGLPSRRVSSSLGFHHSECPSANQSHE